MSGDVSSEEGSVVLRFVLPRGKNETTCSEELSEAFEKCEDNDMKPAWVSCDDASDLTPTKTVGYLQGDPAGCPIAFVNIKT